MDNGKEANKTGMEGKRSSSIPGDSQKDDQPLRPLENGGDRFKSPVNNANDSEARLLKMDPNMTPINSNVKEAAETQNLNQLANPLTKNSKSQASGIQSIQDESNNKKPVNSGILKQSMHRDISTEDLDESTFNTVAEFLMIPEIYSLVSNQTTRDFLQKRRVMLLADPSGFLLRENMTHTEKNQVPGLPIQTSDNRHQDTLLETSEY